MLRSQVIEPVQCVSGAYTDTYTGVPVSGSYIIPLLTPWKPVGAAPCCCYKLVVTLVGTATGVSAFTLAAGNDVLRASCNGLSLGVSDTFYADVGDFGIDKVVYGKQANTFSLFFTGALSTITVNWTVTGQGCVP